MGNRPEKHAKVSANAAGSPYFDATGNGAVMTGRWYIIDGALRPAEDYLIRKLRQRFNAEVGEQVDLARNGKVVRVTLEVMDAEDL